MMEPSKNSLFDESYGSPELTNNNEEQSEDIPVKLEENKNIIELGKPDIADVIANLNLTSPQNINVCKGTTSNRRYSLRAKKRLPSTEYAVTPRKVGCAKKITLETIFETPQEKNGSLVLLGRALKRSIAFNDSITNMKAKRRKLKIKRLARSYKKKCNVTLEDVKRKLKLLEDSEDEDLMDTDMCEI